MRNMKLIYAGIVIPVILASLFIGFVANDVIFDENKDLDSVIDTLAGKPTNSSLPETTEEPLTGQAKLLNPQSEIPIDTWKEGESVKVDYDFASFTLDYSQSDWVDAPTNNPPSPKRLIDKLGNALVDDGNDANLQFISDQESITHKDIFRWVIPISENVPRTGTIYLESGVSFTQYILSITHVSYYFLLNNGGGHTVHSLDVTSPYDTKDITLDIADYIQEDGKIYGKISIQYNTDSNNDDHKLFVGLDHFCYTPDSVTEHVRSKYLYSSGGAISQQLDFWNPSPSDIDIFLPMNWDSIEISPIIDYSLDSENTMEILGVPGNTFFTLRASQNSSNQYLAISDVSGNYLQDIGFEGSWQNNWIDETDPHGFDTITLNSSIVSEGSSSLRLQRYDGAGEMQYFHYTIDGSLYGGGLSGGCYFSFDYYIQNRTGSGTLALSDTVTTLEFPSHEEDKWHSAFYYFNMKASNYVRIVGYIFSGVFFLDNFKIFKVNHQQETIDYSQTLFSGQLNSLTSYGLIPCSYFPINLELRDRTGDSSIKAIETMTDSQGFFYWNFQGRLEKKEHEFRSWSWDSFWGHSEFDDDEPCESTSDWDSLSYSSITESIDSSDYNFGSGSYRFQGTVTDANNRIRYDKSGTWDFTNVDYLVFWVKSNYATSVCDWYMQDGAGGNYGEGNFQTISANTWTFITKEFKNYASGGIVESVVDDIRFDPDLPVSTVVDIHFDGLRLIQSQKSYFTPITTGSIDYAINEQENNPFDYSNYWGFDGWDWQEETTDYWYSNSKAVLLPEDGTLSWTHLDGTTNKAEVRTGDTFSLYSGEIDSFVVRAKCNASYYPMWIKLRVRYTDATTDTSNTQVSTDFALYSVDVTGEATRYIDRVFIQLVNGSGNLDMNYKMIVDFARLYHRDSDLESGYSWEFNEDASTETEVDAIYSLVEGGGCTRSVDNGKLITEFADGVGLGAVFISNISLSSDFASVWIKGESISGRYPSVRFGSISNSYISAIVLISSNGEFELTIAIPDNCYYVAIWSSNSGSGAGIFTLDSVRFISENSPPNLYETQTDFFLENEGFLDYITFTDNIFSGYSTNGDFIGKNLTIGSHSFIYSAYYDYLRFGVTLPSAFYQYDYIVDESGILKIVIHDQSGNVIPFDSFKVYIESVRRYDNYLYFTDVSQTFNLTITDLFDNMLYQDTTEDFENFKEIQITLYSVKIQNLQENPIWVQITRDSRNYSEWIYSYEIIEYRLEAATYGFTVYYCDSLAGDIGALSTNGSWVYLEYAVSADSAIMITGETIKDVFNNVISLSQDLTDVNASLSNQIIDVDIHVSNVNTSITNQVVSVEIFLDNVNTTIGTQLIAIETDINNVNTTLYSQTVSILTQIANINTSLYSQTVSILSDIANINSTLYSQTVSILSQIANINTSLYSQTVSILSDIANINSTLYSQTVSILSQIVNVNTTLYSQTVSILSDILNVNATLYAQDIQILSQIANVNSSLYSQTITILQDLAELKGLFTVHFDFVDGIGIGLAWETFKLYVNDSRQYGKDYYVANQSQIRLKTFDYFNVSLDSANYTINNSCDISIIVDIYEVIFRNNNTQFKSIIEITRGGQNLVLFIEPLGTISHRFTEGKYTLNVSYIVETEIGYDIKDPDNYTIGTHNLFKESFSIGSRLKLMDTTLDSNIVDVGAPDPKATLLGIVQLQIATAFFAGVILASCVSALIAYIFRTRFLIPLDESVDFNTMRKKAQKPIVETSSNILGALPLTEQKHEAASKKKDKRRR